MATTEIEKLERRYAENPQGLTFAPLAEVHRKNGDIPRALELLKTGLELHPNYIPASIVLGRCHWDQGDLPAAEAAFSHVLRLDDENVIALKSLADISERLGRGSEAQRWLKRLISIDRSNEEARQHLARLEGVKAEPSAPADLPAEPPAPVSPPPATIVSAAPSTNVPSSQTEKTPAEEPALLDLTAAIAEPAGAGKSEEREQTTSASSGLPFLDTSEPSRREEASAAEQPAVDGLISQEFVPPKAGGYHLHPELTQEVEGAPDATEPLEVETAAEVELQSSGAAEFRVPNAAEDFLEATRTPKFPELIVEPSPAASSPPASTPLSSPPASSPSVSSPAASAPPTAPLPNVVPPAPAPPGRPSYSTRETHGQSVAEFFRAMLTARPPGTPVVAAEVGGVQQNGQAPAASGQGEARPATDSGKPTAPLPPARAAGSSQDASVSFDDFFGAPAGGSGASKGSADAGEDDLDQFQSWLQNLKR